jgi:hypothetical protein
MFIVGMWAWADLEIKKVQPYIDLAHGNARPETTLLLDYTSVKYAFLFRLSFASNTNFQKQIRAPRQIIQEQALPRLTLSNYRHDGSCLPTFRIGSLHGA